MEEQKTTNPSEQVKEAKPSQKDKKEGKSERKESKFTEYKAEFKKIIWPNRSDLSKKTISVIVVSLFFGAVVFCMDTIYTLGYSAILDLFEQFFF